MNIIDLFFEQAKQNPQKLAIISLKKEITFEQLAQEIQETSLYFLKKGIKKGDKVMVFASVGIDLYRIVLAIFNIGATAVFLDAWVNKKRMEECCKIANCQAFVGFFKIKILSIFSKELRKIPIKLTLYFKKQKLQDKINTKQINIFEKQTETQPQDIALITFTTGSTGTPKGAIRTHAQLLAQYNALAPKINATPTEINMTMLPIMLLVNLASATTTIIANCKFSKLNTMQPKKIMHQLTQYHVNTLIASPFFVKKISEYMLKNNIQLPQISKIFTGGAPVFSQEAHIYMQAFPHAHIEVVYGATEAEPISAVQAKDIVMVHNQMKMHQKQGLYVGKIDKNVQLCIINITNNIIEVNNTQEFNNIVVNNGNIGEIIVSGTHVLAQYINDDVAMKQNKIRVTNQNDTICWHRTGDSGYIDNENNLFLTGKCVNIIQKDNMLIFPFMVEHYFLQIQGINIATVLEINNKIIIFVEKDTTTFKNVLKTTIIQQITMLFDTLNFVFDNIIFVKKIPRDARHYSKIDYDKIKKLYAH